MPGGLLPSGIRHGQGGADALFSSRRIREAGRGQRRRTARCPCPPPELGFDDEPCFHTSRMKVALVAGVHPATDNRQWTVVARIGPETRLLKAARLYPFTLQGSFAAFLDGERLHLRLKLRRQLDLLPVARAGRGTVGAPGGGDPGLDHRGARAAGPGRLLLRLSPARQADAGGAEEGADRHGLTRLCGSADQANTESISASMRSASAVISLLECAPAV